MYNDWRVIEGYPDYEINETGRVRKISTGKELKSSYQGPTLRVTLVNEFGKSHSVSVAELMGETFHTKPREDSKIAFKDGNKFNLTPENLEWRNKPAPKIPEFEIFRNSTIREVETGIVYFSVYAYSDITGEDIVRVKKCIRDPNMTTSKGYHLEIDEYIPYGKWED